MDPFLRRVIERRDSSLMDDDRRLEELDLLTKVEKCRLCGAQTSGLDDGRAPLLVCTACGGRKAQRRLERAGAVHKYFDPRPPEPTLTLEDLFAFSEPPPTEDPTELPMSTNPRSNTMSQKPTVGRIVHYQAFGTPGGEFKSLPRAAIIAEVHSDEEVNVVVFNPGGLFFNRVKFSAEPAPGCWSWPPRESPQPKAQAPSAAPRLPQRAGTAKTGVAVFARRREEAWG